MYLEVVVEVFAVVVNELCDARASRTAVAAAVRHVVRAIAEPRLNAQTNVGVPCVDKLVLDLQYTQPVFTSHTLY